LQRSVRSAEDRHESDENALRRLGFGWPAVAGVCPAAGRSQGRHPAEAVQYRQKKLRKASSFSFTQSKFDIAAYCEAANTTITPGSNAAQHVEFKDVEHDRRLPHVAPRP